MPWPYEQPRKPDAPAIPRARIAQARRRTFAWLTPSREPYSWCESCLSRDEIRYDPDLRKHLCRACFLTTPRPKAKATATEGQPGSAGTSEHE